jgi:predicted permease
LGTALRASQERAGALRHARLRAALLVAEVALSVILVIGAGLLLRSFQQLQQVDYGFDPENVLVTELSLPSSRYPEIASQVDFHRRLLERVRALPGVLAAAATSYPPAWDNVVSFSYVIEGQPRIGPREREDPVALGAVTPGLFRMLGMPLIRGRTFNESDGPDTRAVLVINEAFARRHWPGANPIGERISFQGHEGPWLEVIGVVGDTRQIAADRPSQPNMYIPHAQMTWGWMTWMPLVVRTDGDPKALAPVIREAIWEMDPTLALGSSTPLMSLYSELNARRRFATVLLGVFAALALVLGTVGVYGVLSYSVAQRTREIGLRMALGAQKSSVAGTVVRQGLVLALAGIAIGVPAALGLCRFLEGLVYGVTTTDPVTFLAVPSLLLGTAALAAFVPAHRATRVDPLQALRTE